MILIILLTGATAYFWYDNTATRTQINLKALEKQELTEEIDKTKDQRLELAYIVDREKVYNQLAAKTTTYNRLLDTIAQATPQQVKIENLSFKDTGEVNMAGQAATRDDIAAFTEHLSQSTLFTNVTLNQTDNQNDGVHYIVSMKVKP